jgi:hypothetical protein
MTLSDRLPECPECGGQMHLSNIGTLRCFGKGEYRTGGRGATFADGCGAVRIPYRRAGKVLIRRTRNGKPIPYTSGIERRVLLKMLKRVIVEAGKRETKMVTPAPILEALEKKGLVKVYATSDRGYLVYRLTDKGYAEIKPDV